MIAVAVGVGLIVISSLCLVLAVLEGRAHRYFERNPELLPTNGAAGIANPQDVELFARTITEDAPGLLRHLSYWRSMVGPQTLAFLVDAYRDPSGTAGRKRALQTLMGVYGLPDRDPQLATRMAAVYRAFQAEQASGDHGDPLIREIGHRSPVQLHTWRLLAEFLGAARSKRHMKKELNKIDIKSSRPAIGQDTLEEDMHRLTDSLAELKRNLSAKLPSEQKTSFKGQQGKQKRDTRSKALEDSKNALVEWCRTCPAFTEVGMRQLPEGMLAHEITVALRSSLWKLEGKEVAKDERISMTGLDWPADLKMATEAANVKGFRLSGTALVLMGIALVFLATGIWLLVDPRARAL